MIHVGFDARAAVLDAHRGFGRVAASLAGSLADLLGPSLTLFVPAGAATPDQWRRSGTRIVHLRRPRRGAFLFDSIAWRHTLRRNRVDVLHLPAWGVPARLPVPVVASFYDATPFRFPSPKSRYLRYRLRASTRSLVRASSVQVSSGHSREELLRVLPRVRGRIHVVFLGVGPEFSPGADEQSTKHVLFVGGGDPHKNLCLLLDLYTLPNAQTLPPLMVVGSAAASEHIGTQLAARGLSKRVLLRPGLEDRELVEAYRTALALTLPSKNEGFGLPVLEAMACGCPVVAAASGSLPEVVADAGILLEPDDPAVWLTTLQSLSSDPELRRTLRARGLARAGALTWARTAEGLLEVYRWTCGEDEVSSSRCDEGKDRTPGSRRERTEQPGPGGGS